MPCLCHHPSSCAISSHKPFTALLNLSHSVTRPLHRTSRSTPHLFHQPPSSFAYFHSSSRPLLHGGHHHDDVEVISPSSSSPRSLELDVTREKETTRITLIGMVSNVGLTVVKAIAGFFGNSVAMMADAVHSISDLLTDFVTLWASKVSHKPKDAGHPYGHGKFESLGALVISGLLVGTGVGIGWQAIEHMQWIMQGKSLGMPTGIALVGAVISIAVKEIIYQMTMRVGEKYDSKVIKANAWHHRSDAVSSVVALIGVVGGMLKVPIVDPIAGLFVSGLIVKAAVELGWDSLKDLTDQNVSAKVIEQVESTLKEMKEEGVKGWHQLRGRRMGPYMILDVHIVVDPKLSVTVSHQIAEKVRRRIMEKMPAVSEVLVHIDPALTQSTVESEEASPASSHERVVASPSPLMRPQPEVEKDVRRVLQSEAFEGKVLGLTHFTCHFLNGRLSVQMELVMDRRLTIEDAERVARELDERVRKEVKDVDAVDVHLELTGSHISHASPIQTAGVGDTQSHIHSHP